MNAITKLLVAVLCVSLLAGCGSKQPVESTAAPTEASTAPVLLEAEIIDLYRSAAEPIMTAKNLTARITYSQERIVGGEVYTENMTGTASYSDINTDRMSALVDEQLTFGTYKADYREFYTNGCAYTAVNGYTFATALKPNEFMAAQLPAVLLDPNLYTSVSLSIADGITTITFSGAKTMEVWVAESDHVQLTTASGTATLDASGKLLGTTYQAQYTCGTTQYTLNVTAEATAMDALVLSGQLPTIPENCVALNALDIPRHILQVVGDVYTSQSMSANSTEYIYSDAYDTTTRIQKNSIYTFGTGSDFMATITNEVNTTNYADITTGNTKVLNFRDGQLTYTVNDKEPTLQPDVTQMQMRHDCEDMILSSLLALDQIAGATVEESEESIYITFTGNDQIAQTICTGIYNLFQTNLDDYSDSYTTPTNGGYLCIDKHTGLPTSMGIYLLRTHVFGNVSYDLAYQIDQTLTLSCPDAYSALTGQTPGTDAEA